jgi:phosphate:Na+ symporter
VDHLQKEITQYLVELSQNNLDIEEAEKIPVLLHSVNDVERVSDHAINILELAQRRTEQKLPLTGTALSEAGRIYSVADSMFRKTMDALKEEDQAPARAALEDEKLLNNMHDLLKENHIRRVNIGECDMLAGIVFMDFLDNIEKIGDHLTNIAQGVLRHLRWNLEINSKEAATGSSSSESP